MKKINKSLHFLHRSRTGDGHWKPIKPKKRCGLCRKVFTREVNDRCVKSHIFPDFFYRYLRGCYTGDLKPTLCSMTKDGKVHKESVWTHPLLCEKCDNVTFGKVENIVARSLTFSSPVDPSPSFENLLEYLDRVNRHYKAKGVIEKSVDLREDALEAFYYFLVMTYWRMAASARKRLKVDGRDLESVRQWLTAPFEDKPPFTIKLSLISDAQMTPPSIRIIRRPESSQNTIHDPPEPKRTYSFRILDLLVEIAFEPCHPTSYLWDDFAFDVIRRSDLAGGSLGDLLEWPEPEYEELRGRGLEPYLIFL
ncbi:MAG: hypothetical protein EOP06_03105 [Proteobacteria bacterium]|nr:MAG: hypothetical protein EOP06_03105 [Pseudomonadota bacterium]